MGIPNWDRHRTCMWGPPRNRLLVRLRQIHAASLCLCLHRFYCRYVDDIFVCAPGHAIPRLERIMSSWQSSIKWEVASVGTRNIAFLDLNLSIIDNALAFHTYRKPMNKYLYVPRNSTHEPSMFRGMICGETMRLAATCSSRSALVQQLSIFVSRLKLRGYESMEIKPAIVRGLRRHVARTKGHSMKSSRSDHHRFFLRVPYGSTVNCRLIRAVLRRNRPALERAFAPFASVPITVGLAHGIQSNRLRRMYRMNWAD